MRFILLFCICNALWQHSNVSLNPVPSKKKARTYKKKKKSNNSEVGKVIDALNGINVYFNGSIGNVEGRNTTSDGYNLGLKYQCVEFVKRYYYKIYNHKMPNSYGHAREFYNKNGKAQSYNSDRALNQYRNGGPNKPRVGDIFVFDGNSKNSYGHIGIVSMVGNDRVEMIQQNVGKHTRNMYRLFYENGNYRVDETDLLGWMRK